MRNGLQTTLVLPTLLCLLAPRPVLAQPKQPDLLPDDPELYYSFVFFMEDFGKWLDANNQQRPAHKSELMQSAARYLKVDVKELPKVIETCNDLATAIRQLENQTRNDTQAAIKSGNPPDFPARQAIAAKRQAAIQDAIARLQMDLSQASWTGLRSHINGEHRASVHKAQ